RHDRYIERRRLCFVGSTWIFGDRGRLVVDNSDDDLSLRFNRRLVDKTDEAQSPSLDVSIVSVNGVQVSDTTLADLLVPGDVQVPRSLVGGGDTPDEAGPQGYAASVFTPEPREPEAPSDVSAAAYDEAALVSWAAPYDNNSAITGYTATASTGETCTTSGVTECLVTGLDDDDPVTFTVVATNAIGDSPTSAPSTEVTPDGSTLSAPDTPAPPQIEQAFEAALRVSWTAPDTGGAPIESYTVTAAPGGATCSVDMTVVPAPDLVCDITGLNPAFTPGYEMSVVATNAVGDSAPSGFGPVTPAVGDVHSSLPPPVEPGLSGAPPLIDFQLAGAGSAVVDIPGYVSTPQGGFRSDNPNAEDVTVGGGVLAADFDVVDSRGTAGTPGSVDIGLINKELLRRYLLVSRIDGNIERSQAVVQVNEVGSYAVNSWVVQSDDS
ncbi:MAG: fibronectin type III domain-containing protein, partial [Actinomycetota bacterium]